MGERLADINCRKELEQSNLSKSLSFLFPLRTVFVFLYGTEQEVNLRNCDLGHRVRTDRAAGAGTCASTKVMRAVR